MKHTVVGFVVLTLVSACSATPPPRIGCADVERRLGDAVRAFELAGEALAVPGAATVDDVAVRLERLSLECPAHAPTTVALAAVVAGRDPARAQTLLDRVFAVPGRHPDAAVLRARLAIDEGNLAFARRLLAGQVRLAPDHAGVHEAYAAALYLSGRLDDARDSLARARALGAPPWRVAYHLGLVEEAAGRLGEAERAYTEAVALNPASSDAAARLKGLKARVP